MNFEYIVLASGAVTVAVVYGIYRLAHNKKAPRRPHREDEEDLELEIKEDFIEDVEEKFEGEVYKKAIDAQPTKSLKEYPECFGATDRYSACKRDCSVLDECASTIKLLEGL